VQLPNSFSLFNSLQPLDFYIKKWKLVNYGKQYYSLECSDNAYFIETNKINVCRVGGIGLDLTEVKSINNNAYLVIINNIQQNSNAEKTGKFKIGDSLSSLSIPTSESTDSVSLEGLNLDQVYNTLSKCSAYNNITITTKSLKQRKEVVVQIYSPQSEYLGNFTVFSGYGMNLRTALQSKDLNIYDDRTKRFDSQYQTGLIFLKIFSHFKIKILNIGYEIDCCYIIIFIIIIVIIIIILLLFLLLLLILLILLILLLLF
jgi:hypothetical protein